MARKGIPLQLYVYRIVRDEKGPIHTLEIKERLVAMGIEASYDVVKHACHNLAAGRPAALQIQRVTVGIYQPIPD